jgi:peptidoglycan/LPS O-acetylase OafA/YrhL
MDRNKPYNENHDVSFIKFISKNRQNLMGTSILLILLYHAFCWIPPEQNNLFTLFKYGYIGVDIFMLLSGFGLCYSYTKNSIIMFYVRRLVRIFPLYIISGTIISMFIIQHGEDMSIWDFFCNISTLSYYNVGGTYWNWYIPAIVLFYLLFPIMYIGYKKYSTTLYLITNLVVIITTLFPIPWQYECLITRIPIFVLGILIYLNQRNTSVQKELFLLTFASFIICSAYNLSSYYLTATFCPLLLLLISRLGEEWPQAEKFHIKYKCFNIGKYTLEIFLGNSISYYVIHLIAQHTQQTVAFHFTYWSTTILLSILFIWTNNFIMRKIHFNSGNIHF